MQAPVLAVLYNSRVRDSAHDRRATKHRAVTVTPHLPFCIYRPAYSQPGLSVSRVPASIFCMCLCPGSRTDPPALPDSPPAPRSDAKHSFLPRNCSAAWPGSDARQPKPKASHALLHGVRSCTSSPELPPVAYEIDAVAPTLFGGCQRRWSVGSGGAENTNWRTQVFRAILE